MRAQLIVGPAEEEKQTDLAISTVLVEAGYDVRLIGVDEAVQNHRREVLLRQFSDQAALTIANSGIRWENVARLIPHGMLPNSIVITSSGPQVQYGWELKPVVILNRGASMPDSLSQAVQSLKSGPPRLPVRSGTYAETGYGMRLVEGGAESAVDVWQKFTKFVNPGFRFSTRIREDGSSTPFTITKVMDAMLVLKVDPTGQVVAVAKEELLEHYEVWAKAKRGEVPGDILINDYLMGILDWMDDARLFI